MNVGWPYLRDILYVGPLFIATELSTSLRKHAPAAPGRTETKSYSLDDVKKNLSVCVCTVCSHFGCWFGVSVVFKQMGSSFFLLQKQNNLKKKKLKKKNCMHQLLCCQRLCLNKRGLC